MENYISHPLNTIIESAIVKGISFAGMGLYLEMDDIQLTDFLMGKTKIDDKIASNLERLFGVDKSFWINRQISYTEEMFKKWLDEIPQSFHKQVHNDWEEFDKAVGEERDKFVIDVNKQEWNTKLRCSAENILIMYDQMRERLKPTHESFPKEEWISVEDRKPCEADGQIIVTDNFSLYEIVWKHDESGEYRKPFRYDDDDEAIFKVGLFTHWQPLPQPPITQDK